ncbi:MAG: nucleotidyltransferase domain-containing protein [Leptospirales bacterium]|nr:nucleotidyltransferase domain-containing protein [Leptospirales bacterium]
MSIHPEIVTAVQKRLLEIETEKGVEILYAIESGSRAWGFASQDSDYDVRFIYRHPISWYLSVLPKRDVIEYPIVDIMDYSGWDLRKAFFLANKSNPVLFEWLQSPIVYRQKEAFLDEFKPAALEYFSPIATVYHYLHMATNNYREYLKRDMVKLKKYFYVMRPIFSCMWVQEHKTVPPMEFAVLKNGVLRDASLNNIIEELLARKRSGTELGLAPQIPELNAFLEEQIARFESVAEGFDAAQKPDAERLNNAFRKILRFEG